MLHAPYKMMPQKGVLYLLKGFGIKHDMHIKKSWKVVILSRQSLKQINHQDPKPL
jgi:hypothetical protein